MYESGNSAQEVANYYTVSVGAVFYILKKYKIPRRSTRDSNAIKYDRAAPSFILKENLTQDQKELKTIGVMLYWAEGYKIGKNTIDFANSDPSMVVLFCKFLRQICGITESKIRCSLYCYDTQDLAVLHSYWSSLLSVPLAQFTKPFIKKADEDSKRGPRMVHGLVHVRYCDKKLLRQVLNWIAEYQIESVGGGVVNRIGL